MFNDFNHDNGFTKGFTLISKQEMGVELSLVYCPELSYGLMGYGQSGGGGGVPTGTASLSDIQGAFGGSNPISLSEYYSAATGIPASGTISVDDFRGKASFPLTALALFIDPGNTNCYSGSGSTINDLSDTQTSSLTLVGGTYNSGNGGYFDMSGSGSHIKLNSKNRIDRVVKRYTWHFFIDQDSANCTLIGCGEYYEPPAAHIWMDSSRRLRLNTTNSSGGSSGTATGYQILSANSATVGTGWTHVAITSENYDDCGFYRAKFYINGSLQQTINKAAQSNAPSGKDYALFANPDSGYNFAYNGKVGVVMYYSFSQTDAQVGEVYDAFKGRYGLT